MLVPPSMSAFQNSENTLSPNGGICGHADALGKEYNCGGTINTAQTMQNANMMTMMMGQVGTQAGGMAVQNSAMQPGATQAALMKSTGTYQMATGGVSAAMGSASLAMGGYLVSQGSRLRKAADTLESAANGKDPKNLDQIFSQAGMKSGSISDKQIFAKTAANQERNVASQASMAGAMAIMTGFQQAGSGAATMAQGAQSIALANAYSQLTPAGGSAVTPFAPDFGGTATTSGSPTAITGDGQSAASVAASNPATTAPPIGLGAPINPNAIPSGPPDNPPVQDPNASNGQNQSGMNGGSGLNMGSGSTAPAEPADPSNNHPVAAPQNTAGASYDSSGALPRGTGGGAGGEGGDNPIAALLAGMQKKEEPAQKTDIRFYGGGEQNMSAIPYTPYGKDADLMKRVSDRIRFEHQTGRVGT